VAVTLRSLREALNTDGLRQAQADGSGYIGYPSPCARGGQGGVDDALVIFALLLIMLSYG